MTRRVKIGEVLAEVFSREERVPKETMPQQQSLPEVRLGGGLPESMRPEDVSSLWVGTDDITPDSSQKILQKAAGDLGLSQRGSKKQLWKRIVQRQKDALQKESFLVTNKLRKEMSGPYPDVAKNVKQPTR